MLKDPIEFVVGLVDLGGCGHSDLIEQYVKHTKCPFPVYTDPTQKIHEAFELHRTLSFGKNKPNYIKSSFFSNVAKSAISQMAAGSDMFKGGDIQQVGGEYLINKMIHIYGHTKWKIQEIMWKLSNYVRYCQ
ncbi:unnamed protein product [Rotaria socialis]|uniref:Uncharacterized protein n=2 Tax=Rotaria socialis TaxID=392032 RepID=A0A817Q880_9BILA|nr:unnamed protein product [Rotaria socialis]CAF3299390.1 unnamed protein product [Rotaria socialis]CAF3362638.1 unnamed protein product [Rotaria socialis]CAF3518917.1 unnamed protein product [Rotaria socialis]CAF4254327.1 unnamed protein product [Rotaria socialis]